MRRVTTLAVVLAVVAGLLAMFAFTALSDRAGAAGSRPEQAEVSLMAPGGGFSGPPSSYSNPGTAVASQNRRSNWGSLWDRSSEKRSFPSWVLPARSLSAELSLLWGV